MPWSSTLSSTTSFNSTTESSIIAESIDWLYAALANYHYEMDRQRERRIRQQRLEQGIDDDENSKNNNVVDGNNNTTNADDGNDGDDDLMIDVQFEQERCERYGVPIASYLNRFTS